MKKRYIAPAAETVNVRLINSVLDEGELAPPTENANSWDAKQQLEWDEEATSDLPRDINLWADTDDTEGY